MDPKGIHEEVNKILRSRTFASKSQLRRLLEILHKNMETQAALNPSGVIQELWPDEVRTKRSADVATEMNRLRHALDAYYGREGKSDPILICLPNRSVAASDGTPEKRWIVAMPRDGRNAPVERAAGQAVNVAKRGGLGLLAWLAVAAVALAIAGYLGFRLLAGHDEPKFARLEGSALVIMNAEGKELWRKTFPEGIGPESYYPQFLHTGVLFADLDGRGRTSVLFVYLPPAPGPHSSTLICYSDQGKEKWRWTPGKDLPELLGDPATYRTAALAVLKPTGDKPTRIVAASSHAVWWPSQIAILDANGKLLSEYWHSGHLDSMAVADLEGEGKQEIVAVGVNNDYLQATLVVLDADRIFGASAEVRPQFQIHGLGAAQERLRLLFPRSDLNKALFSYNMASDLTVEQTSIRFDVMECITPPGCQVWYEFNKSFRLISAYPGEDFRSSHVRFYQNRKDAHAFSAEEQTAFQKVRCLVGCNAEYVQVGMQ